MFYALCDYLSTHQSQVNYVSQEAAAFFRGRREIAVQNKQDDTHPQEERIDICSFWYNWFILEITYDALRLIVKSQSIISEWFVNVLKIVQPSIR